MRKWLILALFTTGWLTAGLVIFDKDGISVDAAAPAPERSERIVSMAPNLTEILFSLGLDQRIVGVTSNSDRPAQAAKRPKIGTFWQPNIEAIVALRPQLVVSLDFVQQRQAVRRLERMGYHCITLNIDRLDELFDAIDKIGKATQTQENAGQLVDDIEQRLERFRNPDSADRKVRVLFVVQRRPLRVAGRDTFINDMIELAGGENAIGPTLHKYPPIGAEQVYTSGAEVIIEPTMGQQGTRSAKNEAIKYWERFSGIPAVKNKRIYFIDADKVARLGPRFYEGVEAVWLALKDGRNECVDATSADGEKTGG